MRTRLLSGLCCILLAVVVPTALAQERPEPPHPEMEPEPPHPEGPHFMPVPGRLEEMIEIAMHQNPDVRLAEAEVRRAEAELNAVRLRVVQEVTEIQAERAKLHHAMGRMEERMGEIEAARRAGHEEPAEAREAEREMMEIDGELNRIESHARYLLGLGGLPEGRPGEHGMPMRPAPRPREVPGQYRQLLDSPMTIEFEDKPLHEILAFAAESLGVNIIPDVDLEPIGIPRFALKDVSLRDGLLALTDQCDFLCFVLRDYGILATSKERAARINAPTIPEDVPLFVPELPGPPHE